MLNQEPGNYSCTVLKKYLIIKSDCVGTSSLLWGAGNVRDTNQYVLWTDRYGRVQGITVNTEKREKCNILC